MHDAACRQLYLLRTESEKLFRMSLVDLWIWHLLKTKKKSVSYNMLSGWTGSQLCRSRILLDLKEYIHFLYGNIFYLSTMKVDLSHGLSQRFSKWGGSVFFRGNKERTEELKS